MPAYHRYLRLIRLSLVNTVALTEGSLFLRNGVLHYWHEELTPPNFGAIAKQGVYVYCYITEHGKPYYVGVGPVQTVPRQAFLRSPAP